jgi:hypothetical protein
MRFAQTLGHSGKPFAFSRLWRWLRAGRRRRLAAPFYAYGFNDHLLRDLGVLDGNRSDGTPLP